MLMFPGLYREQIRDDAKSTGAESGDNLQSAVAGNRGRMLRSTIQFEQSLQDDREVIGARRNDKPTQLDPAGEDCNHGSAVLAAITFEG